MISVKMASLGGKGGRSKLALLKSGVHDPLLYGSAATAYIWPDIPDFFLDSFPLRIQHVNNAHVVMR